jgi:hypothetical protein
MILAAAILTAATWCWAPDVNAPRTCTYSKEQCEEIVRLGRRRCLHTIDVATE